MKEKDTYKTITKPSPETLYKEKGSKFFGYAFPIKNEDEVKQYIEALKKQHHSARHWCYAWQLGVEEPELRFRANDDGEPNNSAGMPIYGQIQSFEVTNVLIVVVRYFGGTKLGVGGLISAYKTGAKMALEASKIITKTIDVEYKLFFGYDNMGNVMRIVKERNLNVVNQKLEQDCELTVSIRKRDAVTVFSLFDAIYGVMVKPFND